MATEDIFNEVISERNKKLLLQESERRAKKAVFEQVEKELPTLVRTYVKDQAKKFKTLSPSEITLLIETIVKDNTPRTVNKVIKTEVIKPVETKIQEVKKLDKETIEEIKELKETVRKLKKHIDEFEYPVFIPPMIPNYSAENGTFLMAQGNRLQWSSAGSSGGTSPDVYTVSNVTTDRDLDADSTSIDELADVLGSLIQSLQGAGIIQ